MVGGADKIERMRQRPFAFSLAWAIAAGVLVSEVAPRAQAQAQAPAQAQTSARPARQTAAAAAPAPLPATSPEAVGLSPKGLARITELLQGYVDRKRVAGTVTLILRDGKVAYSSALG